MILSTWSISRQTAARVFTCINQSCDKVNTIGARPRGCILNTSCRCALAGGMNERSCRMDRRTDRTGRQPERFSWHTQHCCQNTRSMTAYNSNDNGPGQCQTRRSGNIQQPNGVKAAAASVALLPFCHFSHVCQSPDSEKCVRGCDRVSVRLCEWFFTFAEIHFYKFWQGICWAPWCRCC